MDGDIERMISSCAVCLSCSHDPPKTDVYPWIWPSRPWSRLHIDHAGPFQGKLFLVVIDAYSKWIEAKIVSTTSTETTINCLKEIFATHGLPDVIVSDNGTSFTSELFRTFLKRNGVRHILCAPYLAASNGQVERAIQTLKNLLRKNSSGNWTTRLSRSLLSMRIAINSTTQKSPAQLLMNRNLKSLINKFHPEGVSEGRMRQEDRFIRNWKPHRVVNEGLAVIARGYHGPRWLPGVVQEKTGPVSIKVETDDGDILNRHLDQVRGCGESEATPSTSSTPQESPNIEDPQADQEMDPAGEASGPILRRSSRLRRPSKFFEMYTSRLEVVPLPDMKSETVARAFYENWIVRFGAPHTVISDQGKQFTSQLFKDLTTLCGIKLRHFTAYHPQCNEKIERLLRTIKTTIRAHNNFKRTETLPSVLLGLRSAIHKDNNHYLFQMVYRKTIRLPGEFFDDSKHHLDAEEFVQQLQKQMELLKPLNEKHHSKTDVFVHKDMKTCSHVFIRTDRVKKPLEPPYDGPSPVLDRTDKYFTLKVKGRNVTISIDRLRPAYLLADSDNLTSEHPAAARPIVSGALPSTSSQQNPDPSDVEKYTEFQGTGSAPDLTRTRSGRIIKKPNKLPIVLSKNQNYAILPAGGQDANSAAPFELAAVPSSNAAAQARRNLADITEDVSPGSEDRFTLVQSRKRRRGPADLPTAAAHSSNGIGGTRTNRQPRSSAGRVHIVEARARQASSTEDQCVYIEHCPELEPFHYISAIDRLVGGTAGVIQISKMNGHYLVGLPNRGLAERIVSEGLEIEGTFLRAFPFRKRAGEPPILDRPHQPLPPATAPRLPQQSSAQPPTQASPSPTMEVSGVLPAAPAAPHQPAVPEQPPQAPTTLPMDASTPAPAPPSRTREKP
ncbi:K02A2.6-like, partial [Cordylochernes scorpioides]